MRSLVAARRMATCKRCGDEQCAWYKTKAGKWMLCQAYEVAGFVAAQIFNPHKCQPDPKKTLKTKTYVRYYISGSREIHGTSHLASEAVPDQWHDTEELAVEYARDLLAEYARDAAELEDGEDDAPLRLTVMEFRIDSTEEPSDYEWQQFATNHSPTREIEI